MPHPSEKDSLSILNHLQTVGHGLVSCMSFFQGVHFYSAQCETTKGICFKKTFQFDNLNKNTFIIYLLIMFVCICNCVPQNRHGANRRNWSIITIISLHVTHGDSTQVITCLYLPFHQLHSHNYFDGEDSHTSATMLSLWMNVSFYIVLILFLLCFSVLCDGTGDWTWSSVNAWLALTS